MDQTKLATVSVVQVALEDINTHKYWQIEIKRIIKDFCVCVINVCVILPQQQKVTLGLHWSTSGGEYL